MGSKRILSDTKELTDIVSILVRCQSERMYMLAYQQSTDYCLPNATLDRRTWGTACRDLTLKFLGEELRPDNLIKVIRIWQGDNKPHLINAVFEINLTVEHKNRLRIPESMQNREKLVWVKLHEVLRLAQLEMLASPELKMYFSQGSGDADMKILKEAAEITSNVVLEVNKSHVISPRALTVYDALISSLSLTETDMTTIYQEYLKLCYPNLLMSMKVFRKFALKLRWPETMVSQLFRMGDLSDRKALTFREVMYIAGALEPDITYTGSSAEARCKLVFRYFDADRDSKLSPSEFRNLISAIREAKPSAHLQGTSLDKDVEKGYKDLGLKHEADISMRDFVLNIGLLKFRGTSVVVKSSISIRVLIRNVVSDTDDEEDHKKVTRHEYPDYFLAWHTVKVDLNGIKDIQDLLQTDGLFAKTPPASLRKYASERSLNMFDQSNVASLTLNNLKYYAQLLSKRDPSPYEYKKVMLSIPNQLMQLCKTVTNIFQSEPRLLRISSPVYILGDLHGNFPDVCCFERAFWSMGLHLSPACMLLLGDYVDRGIYGVEVVAYLFAQKVKNPNKVYLLRGNHELREVQKNFSFYDECIKKFGQELGLTLWEEVNRAFDYLPLAAVIDNKVFCCHGGIPAPWLCPHIDYIDRIPSPLANPDEESALAWDILWNDPIREDIVERDVEEELIENEGFALNRRRGTAHVFDANALSKFLNRNKLSFLVRAHEVQQAGVQIQLNRKMMTVFSSSGYNGGINDAACILVYHKKLRIYCLDTGDFHKHRDS